ncbi:MAG: hypothetical protein Q8O56_13880 [Solirubrobacteraceae bacterium]|nr:hypothetical protein [Solirubrobacteraceae bacterium]
MNKPTIWATQVLINLRAAIVYGAPTVTNRNYQGQINQAGDRVKVTGLVDPTIFDVTPNTDIPDPETLTDTEAELVIDQNKGFNFQVDDVDQLQHAVGGIQLQSAANAARRLAEVADNSIALKMVSEVDAANKIGTTGTPLDVDAPEPGVALQAGATSTYRVLVRLGIKLDKKNVPSAGRWVVLPPFMMGALAVDQRFTAATQQGEDVLRNGFQGRCAGFDVYTTSAVPVSADKYSVIAGSTIATSYAEQLINVEFYRPQLRFANAAKGQHVYGHKTFYPEALAVATVQDVSDLDT